MKVLRKPLWISSVCGFCLFLLVIQIAALPISRAESDFYDIYWNEDAHENPVFNPGRAYYPSVIYDEKHFGQNIEDPIDLTGLFSDQKYTAKPHYKMWYSGRDGANTNCIGFAYSENGYDWIHVADGSGSKPIAGLKKPHHVCTVYDENEFGIPGSGRYRIWYWDTDRLYYNSALPSGYPIRYAESLDGVNWANDRVCVQPAETGLLFEAAGAWNRGSYGPGQVVFNQSYTLLNHENPYENRYVMFYDGTTGGAEALGLGYSMDGIEWHRWSGPVWTVSESKVIKLFNAREGSNWNDMPFEVSGILNDIVSTSSQFAWVAGEGGVAYRTIDGGLKWTPVTSGTNDDINAIGAAPQYGTVYRNLVYFAGDDGFIARSLDGENFVTQNSNTQSNLRDIFAVDANVAWAAGESGTVLRTTNGGENWISVNSDEYEDTDINGIYAINANVAFAVGSEGILLQTINGGSEWISVETSTTVDLNAIHGSSASNVFAVGDDGIILFYNGINTAIQTPNATTDFLDVSVGNADHAFVCGSNGKIFKTDDGGATWIDDSPYAKSQQTIKGISYNFNTPLLVEGDDGQWDGTQVNFGSNTTPSRGYVSYATVLPNPEKEGFHAWYSGGYSLSGVGGLHGIGYAKSPDGFNWQRFPNNPILHRNDGKDWRSNRTYTPIVIYDSNEFGGNGDQRQYKMWFSGRSETTGIYSVGYACNLKSPFLATAPATLVTHNGATLNGNIANTGGENAERGFRWRVKGTGSWTAWADTGTFGTGTFSHPITGLAQGATYEYQATAENSAGRAYGETQEFTTIDIPKPATAPATLVTHNGATLNGNITNTGGENAERGFRWRVKGTGSWTAWADTGTFGTGTFSHPITGLAQGATYEYQATAENSAGRAYGETQEFVIIKDVELGLRLIAQPAGRINPGDTITYRMEIDNKSEITAHNAQLKGNVPDDTTYVANSTKMNGIDQNDRGGTTPLEEGLDVHSPGEAPGVILPNDTITVEFQAAVDSGIPNGTMIIFSVELTADDALPVDDSIISIYQTDIPRTWYFAEGATIDNFDEWILIQNTNDEEANVKIHYYSEDGETLQREHLITANSRFTVNVNEDIGKPVSHSTKVDSNVPILVERAMYFNYEGEIPGGHAAFGTPELSETWYFAEGFTGSEHSSFEEWILIFNPTDEQVEVDLINMIEDSNNIDLGFTVKPRSRLSVNLGDYIGENKFVSTKVAASQPIVAERSMYFEYKNKWSGGHVVIGAVSPAVKWYLAEGYTGWQDSEFETWILFQNPSDKQARVTCEFQIQGKENVIKEYVIPAQKRFTICLNDILEPDSFVSTVIESDNEVPIIVERAMYFNYTSSISGGHNVMGSIQMSPTWYLAEGYTGNAGSRFDEWILIQNASVDPMVVAVDYIIGSNRVETKEYEVDASSRYTINVNDELEIYGNELEVSATVRVLSGQPKLMAERAMYFIYRNEWDGGHAVVAFP